MGLAFASLIGAVYVVAVIVVVLYVIPEYWQRLVSPQLNTLTDTPGLLLTQVLAASGLLWFGRQVLGAGAPQGIHGGIFLVISLAITIFFLWRAFALNIEGPPGLIAGGIFATFLLFFAFRFMVGRMGTGWMIGLEEQGWFSSASFKRTLGQKARRLTILGILLICGTGIYSLWLGGTLPKNWAIELPFDDFSSFTLLPEARTMIPVLLVALALWFAFRAVNVPGFAEFLIATEAEMNKVSWTPKKRLAQDTVVVLTTTLLLALFLLIVDLFWGWLLSRETIGVLPSQSTGAEKGKGPQQAKW